MNEMDVTDLASFEDQDILDLGSSEGDRDVKRVPLFKLDEKTYMIPAEPPASVALRYLWDVRRGGPDVAAGRLLEDLLGEEAYEKLMNSQITMDQLQQVMQAAEKHVLGSIESAQGKD